MWFVGTCWFVTLISACLAAAQMFFGLKDATGAPQQAAIAAIAVASVVIPYVFTRAVEGMALLESLKRQRQGDRQPAPPATRERAEPLFREGPHDRPAEPGRR